MKYVPLLLLLSLPLWAQIKPSASVKTIISDSLSPTLPSNRINARKLRAVTNALADQLIRHDTATAFLMSLSVVRSLTANHPATLSLSDRNRQGSFYRDDSDLSSPDNGGTVLVTASGKRYKRVVTGGYLTPEMFGAVPNDNVDDAAAIQAAIDATCSTVGGTVRPAHTIIFSEGTYLVNSIINLTNTRTSATLQRDGITLRGQGKTRTVIKGKTGSGKAILDVTGSQFLTLENLSLVSDGTTGSSTIGVYSGLFSVLQQTQNQLISNVAVFMHDDTSANNHSGTIAFWNFGGEENTYHSIYFKANRPAIFTAQAGTPGSYLNAFSALASSHSLGVTTFSGECFLEALASVYPALELVDVNSLEAQNLYISGSVSPGITPTQFQAIRIRGGATNCRLRGTIEGFSGSLEIFGRLMNSVVDFQYGNTNLPGKHVIRLIHGSEGYITKSIIRMQFSQESTRPVWAVTTSLANQIASCYVQDSQLYSSDSLKRLDLPEKLSFNPSTWGVTLFSGDHPPKSVESSAQTIQIPRTMIRGFAGSNPATTIARVTLPTAVTNTSAYSMAIRVEGLGGHAVYVSDGSTSLFWQGTLTLSADKNGVLTSGTAVTSNVASAAVNPSSNNLTGIALSTTQSGNVLSIILTPTVTGSNNEAVYLAGKITLLWSGHSCNAPTLSY